MIETSRPDIVALKKGGGSCTILGFLTKEKPKVEKSQEVQRKIARLEFEEFQGSNIVPVIIIIIIMCIFIYRTYHLSSHGGLQLFIERKSNQHYSNH